MDNNPPKQEYQFGNEISVFTGLNKDAIVMCVLYEVFENHCTVPVQLPDFKITA